MNTQIVNSVLDWGRKKSPELLTAVGLMSLTGMSAYCLFAPEPKLVLDEAKHAKASEEGEDVVEFTKWDAAKALAIEYWPALALFVVGAGCIIASDCIDDKRNAALTAAYTVSETALKTFKDKAIEKLGGDKVNEIQEEADLEIAKHKAGPPADESAIFGTAAGKSLCFDSYSGRYFWGDLESIRRTFNTLNEQLLNEDFVSLNELYVYLGLPECDMGDDMGFHIAETGIIKPRYSSKLVEEGLYEGAPCLVIAYDIQPRYYRDMY